jgi:hypothetical protein
VLDEGSDNVQEEIYLLFLVAIFLDSCASKPRSVDNSPTLNPDVQRFLIDSI